MSCRQASQAMPQYYYEITIFSDIHYQLLVHTLWNIISTPLSLYHFEHLSMFLIMSLVVTVIFNYLKKYLPNCSNMLQYHSKPNKCVSQY